MTGPLLELTGIDWSREGRRILNRVSLTVQRGEIVTLIGPNGAGKSTLVQIAVGLLKPDAGVCRRQPGLRIGYVPQALTLDPSLPLTVGGFMRLQARKLAAADVGQALAETGVGDLHDRSVHALSGGEWQRVLLARALLQQPDLLVLDEPMQGVDLTGQEELYRLLAEVPRRYRCGILMVSHDLHLVMASTDRVICLNGHVCCEGHPESVTSHPEYLRLFGWQGSQGLAVYSHHHDHRHDVHGCVTPSSAQAGS
ncbi:zinc transport system ATP-binding protein [Fluviicoccus keumensis]|uniref:Zinc transport system ATP-binding protein n=1 Tax=Fluviicoccus keumensis TaxID=1435465 RepID=A0A4Q7ZBS2_9GAMM|nr:zinc ABC transporter ATP-binding protein ZnuC [Fluviicoccus keumensis]RZU48058.1 zinc transport system ATP-binding protein [Fluviicoccus keumensis]